MGRINRMGVGLQHGRTGEDGMFAIIFKLAWRWVFRKFLIGKGLNNDLPRNFVQNLLIIHYFTFKYKLNCHLVYRSCIQCTLRNQFINTFLLNPSGLIWGKNVPLFFLLRGERFHSLFTPWNVPGTLYATKTCTTVVLWRILVSKVPH